MTELAIRYLLARRQQSLLILIGVFLGTAGYVAISGFFIGFQEYFLSQMVHNTAHIRITTRDALVRREVLDAPLFHRTRALWSVAPYGRVDGERFSDLRGWHRRLNSDPRVKAYTPQLTVAALFAKGKSAVSASLIGCDPRTQSKVVNLFDKMSSGRFEDLNAGGNRIVVGSELAAKLGLTVGQTLSAVSASGPRTPFQVTGIFSSGNKAVDLNAYCSLSDAQLISGKPGLVNEIAVKLHDHESAHEVASAWAKLLPEKPTSWREQMAGAFTMFKIQTGMRTLVTLTVMLIAGFGIYNVLTMTVAQKRRDIAILRSMGYGAGEVERLFLLQGIFLGAAGAALGLIAGYLFCLKLQTIPFSDPSGMRKADHLHISWSPWIYAQAAGFSMLSSMLAGYLPAKAAGKLSPIEIIRQGE